MFAVRCRERSTSTGTGDFTTVGAEPGCRSLSSVFGVNSIFFQYTIISRDGSQWEEGYGYCGGTTTLKRAVIVANSSGGTTALNFSAGTKDVFATPISTGVTPTLPISPTSIITNRVVANPMHGTFTDSASSLTTDMIYYVPYLYAANGNVNAVAFYTHTAGGASVKTAIYSIDPTTGLPKYRVALGGATVCSATTWQFSTFTSIYLPVGWYYLAFQPSATMAAGVVTTNGIGALGLDGSNNQLAALTEAGAYSSGPQATAIPTAAVNTSVPPYLALRQG